MGTLFSSVKNNHMSSALAANRLSTSTLLVPPTTDFFSSTTGFFACVGWASDSASTVMSWGVALPLAEPDGAVVVGWPCFSTRTLGKESNLAARMGGKSDRRNVRKASSLMSENSYYSS
jgi:hypothetical protein